MYKIKVYGTELLPICDTDPLHSRDGFRDFCILDGFSSKLFEKAVNFLQLTLTKPSFYQKIPNVFGFEPEFFGIFDSKGHLVIGGHLIYSADTYQQTWVTPIYDKKHINVIKSKIKTYENEARSEVALADNFGTADTLRKYARREALALADSKYRELIYEYLLKFKVKLYKRPDQSESPVKQDITETAIHKLLETYSFTFYFETLDEVITFFKEGIKESDGLPASFYECTLFFVIHDAQNDVALAGKFWAEKTEKSTIAKISISLRDDTDEMPIECLMGNLLDAHINNNENNFNRQQHDYGKAFDLDYELMINRLQYRAWENFERYSYLHDALKTVRIPSNFIHIEEYEIEDFEVQ